MVVDHDNRDGGHHTYQRGHRNREYAQRDRWEDSDQRGRGRGRHPPGLKGKEIGLFYAKRSKEKAAQDEKSKVRNL